MTSSKVQFLRQEEWSSNQVEIISKHGFGVLYTSVQRWTTMKLWGTCFRTGLCALALDKSEIPIWTDLIRTDLHGSRSKHHGQLLKLSKANLLLSCIQYKLRGGAQKSFWTKSGYTLKHQNSLQTVTGDACTDLILTTGFAAALYSFWGRIYLLFVSLQQYCIIQ